MGTECCSLTTSTDLHQPITTEQKSSQTQSRIRMYKTRTRNTTKRTTMTSTDDYPTNVFNASTMTQWEHTTMNDMQTQISSDMSIQTVGDVSNLLDYPISSSENNNNPSVIVQTLPISMTSTQMQTTMEYPFPTGIDQDNTNNYLLRDQESVGTSCFLDEFLLDNLAKNDASSSVLFDFDAMDLLDLIDNGTQTYPLSTSHETQTTTQWNSMLLNEDEWIETMMNN